MNKIQCFLTSQTPGKKPSKTHVEALKTALYPFAVSFHLFGFRSPLQPFFAFLFCFNFECHITLALTLAFIIKNNRPRRFGLCPKEEKRYVKIAPPRSAIFPNH